MMRPNKGVLLFKKKLGKFILYAEPMYNIYIGSICRQLAEEETGLGAAL